MAIKKISKTTQQDIALMAANGATQTRIAKSTGIHPTTVKRILADPATISEIEHYSKIMAERMLAKAEAIIDAITDSDIEKAGLRDKTVAIGILSDKARGAYGLDKPPPLVNLNVITPVDLSKYM